MLYIINDSVLLQKGHVNAIIYNPHNKKLLHVKNKLADILISGEPLPDRVREFIGGDASVESVESYLKSHPIQLEIDSVYVDLTNACNLKCEGCYSYREQDKKNISTDKLAAVSTLKKTTETEIILLGGEPLLYPKDKLQHYLKQWSSEFKKVTLFTNGYYFNDTWADFFSVYKIRVRFTLYSFEYQKHDNYVARQGAFDAVMKAIARAKAVHLDYKVNLILSGNEYLQGEESLQALGLSAENTFIDLIRPTAGYAVEDYVSIKKKKGEIKRPVKYKTFLRAIRDSQYHSCYCGKIAVSVDGRISQCPWEKNRAVGHITQFDKTQVEQGWRLPLHEAYTWCAACEFSFLCFDCADLNSKNVAAPTRPVSCNYNPFTGASEC